MEHSVNELAISVGNYRLGAKFHAKLDAYPPGTLEEACEKYGLSEIHKIVWGISFEDLDTKVRTCPKAVDGVDAYSHTPLDYAIAFRNSDHVKILLSHGADIGRRPEYLFWTAVQSGNCAFTQLLLDRGLRPNNLVPPPPKLDPFSPENNFDRFSFSAFQNFEYYIESYEHCTSAMDRLLVNCGFDFNTGISHGLTALMACSRRDCWDGSCGGIKRMKRLLECGVDLEIRDHSGWTAIHHALYNDNIRAVELLTEYGARLDARTSNGETVLHMVVQRTTEVVVVHALRKPSILQLDLDAPRHDGKTAFNLLRRRAAKIGSSDWNCLPWTKMDKSYIGLHLEVIRALGSLFFDIQTCQDVPLEDRYRDLPIAALRQVTVAETAEDIYSSSSDHGIYESDGDTYPTWSDDASNATSDEDEFPTNHNSNETICAPPGAWPERG